MKIVKRAIIALVLTVILLPILFVTYLSLKADGIIMSYDNYLFQNKLKEKLDSGATAIRIKDLTNFEWDAAHVYLQFTYDDDVLIDNPLVWSISFYKDKKKVKYFRVRSQIAQLQPTGDSIFFSYEYSNADFLKIQYENEKRIILLTNK